jgi:hypothetical protein
VGGAGFAHLVLPTFRSCVRLTKCLSGGGQWDRVGFICVGTSCWAGSVCANRRVVRAGSKARTALCSGLAPLL